MFHVAGRDERLEVLRRSTDWFKVRTDRGVEGWVTAREMTQTVLADGSRFQYSFGDRAGFTSHRWEAGIFPYADYGGASEISGYASFSLVNDLQVEFSIGEFLGSASNGTLAEIGLAHVFFPEWRLSPFVTLGTGVVHVEPKATLVVPSDRTDQSAYVGGGLRFYLTRRFFLRGEYRNHTVFTKRNQNEQVDEWKFGFAFFL